MRVCRRRNTKFVLFCQASQERQTLCQSNCATTIGTVTLYAEVEATTMLDRRCERNPRSLVANKCFFFEFQNQNEFPTKRLRLEKCVRRIIFCNPNRAHNWYHSVFAIAWNVLDSHCGRLQQLVLPCHGTWSNERLQRNASNLQAHANSSNEKKRNN